MITSTIWYSLLCSSANLCRQLWSYGELKSSTRINTENRELVVRHFLMWFLDFCCGCSESWLAWARFTSIFGLGFVLGILVKVPETEHTSTGYKQIHNTRNRVPVNHTGNGKTQQWRRWRACELACVTQAAKSMQCYMYARHTLTLYRLSRLIVDYRSRTMCSPCNASCCSCILTFPVPLLRSVVRADPKPLEDSNSLRWQMHYQMLSNSFTECTRRFGCSGFSIIEMSLTLTSVYIHCPHQSLPIIH